MQDKPRERVVEADNVRGPAQPAVQPHSEGQRLLQVLHGGRTPRCGLLDYGRDIARIVPGAAEVSAWATVCAPSVAVAALLARETR